MSHDNVDRSLRATPPPCPRCGGPLARVHRRTTDHWVSAVRRGPVYRYQCRSVACHWGGLLAAAVPQGGDRRRPLVGGAVMALAVAAALVGLVTGMPDRWRLGEGVEPAPAQRAAGLRPLPRVAEAVVLPAGWHAVGNALPPDDARHAGRAAGLQLRHGCTWGVPGRDPYRGTAEQALQAAGLPADAVRVLAQRIRRGESDGELTLARDGIRSTDGQRQFGRRLLASTYGMTLCFDTLVNFAEGHAERAPLFEFTSADGRRFSVIVPDVCGNVSVVSELPPGGIVLGERAERASAPVAPGGVETVASSVATATGPSAAPRHAGPDRGQTHAGAPNAGAGGRPSRPAPPNPRDPTTPDAPEPPVKPPAIDPAPGTLAGEATPPAIDPSTGTQPVPGDGDAPLPKDTAPPEPALPPTPGAPKPDGPAPPAATGAPDTPSTTPPGTPSPALPDASPAPPTEPPSWLTPELPLGEVPPPLVDPGDTPGTGTQPVPGDGDAPPPEDKAPPEPALPPTPGAPKPGDPAPPATPGAPDMPTPTPPVSPSPAPPDAPPAPPTEPPSWLTPELPLGEVPPPLVDPGDPETPHQVPAPGTLPTSLLGLAALVSIRIWRRRRQR